MGRSQGCWGVMTIGWMLAVSPTVMHGQAADVAQLADDYLAAVVERNPESATIQTLEGADHGRLTDNSPEALRAWQAVEDEFLVRLQGIDPSGLSGTETEVTLAYLQHSIGSAVDTRSCRAEWTGVNPIFGWHLILNQLAAVQPVGTSEEREATLRRWRAIPDWIRQEIRNLRSGVAGGVTAPVEAVDRVVAQLRSFVEIPAGQSPLASPAGRAADPEFAAALVGIIQNDVAPAYREYLAFLEDDYRASARTRPGLVHTDPGIECYRALVRSFTSLDEDPITLHEAGLAELQRLRAERAALVARQGEEGIGALRAERGRPENRFASREEIIEYVEGLVARADSVADEWFELVPAGDVVVRPYPEFQEANAPGGQYLPPATDGSRPGVYMLNTSNVATRSRIGLETLTWHEGVPGHHFQLALANERPDAHPATRVLFNSGFAEGWALYAERLADDMGLFSNDAQRLEMINSQIFRAARMVVDPGIHALGWSREEADQFMSEATGTPPGTFAFEIDRYISLPGQAVAYLSGRLVLDRLRADAEERLGDQFDVKTFHRLVLENGSVPLPWLEERIGRWGGGP